MSLSHLLTISRALRLHLNGNLAAFLIHWDSVLSSALTLKDLPVFPSVSVRELSLQSSICRSTAQQCASHSHTSKGTGTQRAGAVLLEYPGMCDPAMSRGCWEYLYVWGSCPSLSVQLSIWFSEQHPAVSLGFFHLLHRDLSLLMLNFSVNLY